MTQHLRSWVVGVLLVVLLAAMILVWPSDPKASSGLFAAIKLPPDARSAAFVMLAGALGAAIGVGYMLTSPMPDRQQLVTIPFLVVRTAMGAALAFAVWLLVRGGMLSLTVNTGSGGATTANAWTVAGVSVIVGLFIEQAKALLNRVANSVFGTTAESDSTAAG